MAHNNKKDEPNPLHIRTEFMYRRKVVHINKSRNALRALGMAGQYMAINLYGANVVHIIDGRNERLLFELVLRPSGKVETTYKANPRDFATASTLKQMRKRGLVS